MINFSNKYLKKLFSILNCIHCHLPSIHKDTLVTKTSFKQSLDSFLAEVWDPGWLNKEMATKTGAAGNNLHDVHTLQNM